MRTISRERIQEMRTTLVGKRIALIHTSDPYTTLKPGSEGVVTFIDDIGTVFADWDDGSGLGMVYGEDTYRVVDQ